METGRGHNVRALFQFPHVKRLRNTVLPYL